MISHKPEILAPAGDAAAFLAALAAGADAVYAGLKNYSARMRADNFSLNELARLTELAHSMDRKVYLAINNMLAPDDPVRAARLIARLARSVAPDGLIIADPGLPHLAREAGFTGEIHLSTLANVTHPAALASARALGASRVVLPRELSLDEIKAMATACPEGLALEVFVHGALCHNVSGRCYWSSLLGGKSGLRGRCVQPCRRVYNRRDIKERFFSCQDLGLDVLTRTMLNVPQVTAWKIEGRNKGPHYVYYTVAAYKLIRDEGTDAPAKNKAMDYLAQALGRATTHYGFLPQRPYNPVKVGEQTCSGLQIGKLTREGMRKYFTRPRMPLLAGDLLRLGYEDDAWHQLIKVTKNVPKAGRFDVKVEGAAKPAASSPIFLIDRREPELVRELNKMRSALEKINEPEVASVPFEPTPIRPARVPKRPRIIDVHVWRKAPAQKPGLDQGAWVHPKNAHELHVGRSRDAQWWLPPVIWPNEEGEFAVLISDMVRRGATYFVLNAPWQVGLMPQKKLPDLRLIAGPFCNLANPFALDALKDMGFSAAFVSPELPKEDLLALPRLSPLPLGIVIKGFWPFGISRVLAHEVSTWENLSSPKGEVLWVARNGQNYWIYPAWELDLTEHKEALREAGYTTFATLREPAPKTLPNLTRKSEFNWNNKLL
jgi:putative protease